MPFENLSKPYHKDFPVAVLFQAGRGLCLIAMVLSVYNSTALLMIPFVSMFFLKVSSYFLKTVKVHGIVSELT